MKNLLDVNASTYSKTGNSRDSAWCVAVREGKFRILQCLAEVRPYDLTGNIQLALDVLECAIENEILGMIRYCLELRVFSSCAIREYLYTAVERQSIEIMKLFVSSGATVNEWYGEDQSPF